MLSGFVFVAFFFVCLLSHERRMLGGPMESTVCDAGTDSVHVGVVMSVQQAL